MFIDANAGLMLHIAKYLIRLDKRHINIADFSVQQSGAMVARCFQDAKHCSLIQSRQASGGTDANGFGNHFNDLDGFVAFNANAFKWLSFTE